MKTKAKTCVIDHCSLFFAKFADKVGKKWVYPICRRGFTFVELLIVIAIISVLAIMALPSYTQLRNVAKRAQCKADLREVERNIQAFNLEKGYYPDLLDNTVSHVLLDPWGKRFEYRNSKSSLGDPYRIVSGGDTLGNDDFDLFSNGPDGTSTWVLTDSTSTDDIIRATNGGFVGETKDYF